MARSLMQRVRMGGGADGGIRIPLFVHKEFILPGTMPATAGNWGVPFFKPYDGTWELVSVTERHKTAGSDGSAVTIMMKKADSGTALSSGTDMLSAGIDLKATAETDQAGSLHGTLANIQVSAGTSVGFVLTGTPTSSAGVFIQTVWKQV